MLDSIFKIFTMLGGLALFMYGMKMMSDSIETLTGDRLKSLFTKITNNPLKGVGIGFAVTAVIQSSSAMTVMLVGFVNVGLLSLYQATSVIMGSAIGTTVTAQLSSLSALNITAIMSLVATIGMALIMFAKKDNLHRLGGFLLGFGMLFIGLNLMSSSMKGFAYNPDGSPSDFAVFMLNSFTNPVMNLLAGVVFTAIIQSSSAATGILIAFGTAGMVNLDTAMFMVLGMNIGTCITAIIASVGTTANAKRTAIIHLLFKTIGSVIVAVLLFIFIEPIKSAIVAISGGMIERQIANFHTLFNVFITILLLPFSKQLIKLSTILIPDKKKAEQKSNRLYYLDERLLQTPSVAMSQVYNEIRNMGDIAIENVTLAIDMLASGDLSKVEETKKNEETINYLNREIANYLVKLVGSDISDKDEAIVATFFHVISDIERIGDYGENIMKFAVKAKNEQIIFSDDAISEIKGVAQKLGQLYREVIYAFIKRKLELLPAIDLLEDSIDEDKRKMQEMHIERLNKGQCSVESGAIYLSLASQLERIADHMTNIAYSIKTYEDKIKSLSDEELQAK